MGRLQGLGVAAASNLMQRVRAEIGSRPPALPLLFLCRGVDECQPCLGGLRGPQYSTQSSPLNNSAESTGGTEAPVSSRSVDPLEAHKFRAEAASWWDTRGPHALLHSMNPVRVSFILSATCRTLQRSEEDLRPFKGLRILDVGCGGGLLCEPLSRLGASVTGVDVVPSSIRIARTHAEGSYGLEPINYVCTSAEDLVAQGQQFDLVTCLEVLEHVADPVDFVATLGKLCAPRSGLLFLSTLNRTPRALAAAVVAVEQILQWVPKGTHDWSKFITPEELAAVLRFSTDFRMKELAGLELDPVAGKWSLTSDLAINYIALATQHPTDTA